MEEYPLSLASLQVFIDGSFPKFDAEWKEATNNERRWRAKNFTESQEKEIRAQGRQPYSMAHAMLKLKRMVGLQQSQRTEYNILASQDPNDEIKAELAKLQVHAVERRSEFLNVESEIFESGMAIDIGVSKMDLDYSDIYPRVVVKKLDYKDFMWDRNSKEYDIDKDARWCCEIDKLYRKQINQKYKISENIIQSLPEGNINTFQGRDKFSYYVTESKSGNTDYDIITVFNFYVKEPRTVYYVLFPDTEGINGNSNVIESKHSTREAAEERLKELQLPYLLKGLPEEGEIQDKEVVGIDRYLFTYNAILEYEKTELEMFPYNIYFCFKFADWHISYMDILKDPQKFYDRLFMQIDYALGIDNKSTTQLNVNNLGDGEDTTTAVEKYEKGEVIIANSDRPVFTSIERKGANPQWMQIADSISRILDELSGGQPFNSKSNAGDSGKKVNALINQGSLVAKPPLDNLRRWKTAVGRNILWWIRHYEEAEDVIRVQGGALTPEMIQLLQENGIYEPSKLNDGSGFVSINKEGHELSYLKDSEFELEVSEEAMSDSERHAKLLIATEQERSDPTLTQIPEWKIYKIGLMDIPQSEKYKIIEGIKRQIKQVQQQQMQQDQIEAQKLNLEKANIINKAPQGTFAA